MPSDDTRIIVFRSRVRPEHEAAYGPRADAVYELATKMPGFISAADFTAEDGERVAIIEFDSPEHLRAWRLHGDHAVAQQEGRSRWYAEYRLQICVPLRESRYAAGRDPEPLPAAGSDALAAIDAEGGCACSELRYRVRGAPLVSTLCHCVDCRKACGATPVAWVVFLREDFSWTRGAPRTRASSARAERDFCGGCGAQIAYRSVEDASWIDVTTSSLDDPALVPPRDHIWVRSKIPWVHLRDELPRHERERP